MLTVKNVTSRVGPRSLLRDVSLDLHEGTIYGLVGPNGAGKTTLIDVISGFRRSQQGRIFLNGQRISHLPPWSRIRLGLCRSFQGARVVPHLSVQEHIQLTRSEEKVTSVIAQWMDEWGSKPAKELSWGQQKLLSVSCAVAAGGNVVLLDEPVAGLAPAYREILRGLIFRIKDLGGVVLIVEHDQEVVERWCDFAFLMIEGSLVNSGPSKSVFHQLIESRPRP